MLSWFFGKPFEEQVIEFEEKINKIANSLIKSSEQKSVEGEYDIASLLNPDTCNQFTIFLGSELDKRFTKVEIESINSAIYLAKRKKKSHRNNKNQNQNDDFENDMDVDNYIGKNKKYNKKYLCNKIASHYIRTFNMISAILSAINPENNMCSRRIKALYEASLDDTSSGYVRVCHSDDTNTTNMLYPDNIEMMPGIKYLLKLYYFYLMQDESQTNPIERNRIKREFMKLNEALSSVYVFEGQIKPLPSIIKNVEDTLNKSMNHLEQVNNQNGNKAKQNSTDKTIMELTDLVSELKGQIADLKEEQSRKGIDQEMIDKSLEKISENIGDKLQIFEGDVESKIKALEEKINLTVNQKISEEIENENFQETNLNKKLQTPSSRNNLNYNYGNANNSGLKSTQSPKKSKNNADFNEDEKEINMNINNNYELDTESPKSSTVEPVAKSQPKPIEPEYKPKTVEPEYEPKPASVESEYKSKPELVEPVAEPKPVSVEPEYKPKPVSVEPEYKPKPVSVTEPKPLSVEPDTEPKPVSVEPVTKPLSTETKSLIQNVESASPPAIEPLDDLLEPVKQQEQIKPKNNKQQLGGGEEEYNNLNQVENYGNQVNQPVENVININRTNLNENIDKSIVEQFLQFVGKYNNDTNVSDEYKIKLRPKTVEEISNFKCSQEPSNLLIKINDAKFSDFKSIYQAMKNHYINSTTGLMDILENSLVEKTDEGMFKLKTLTNNQLNDVQSSLMRELTTYYTKCQEYYENGFAALAKALEEK